MDSDIISFRGRPPNAAAQPVVSFNRQELSAILSVYGRMVSAGEWRDYAIDNLHDSAVFSIFRRSSEAPLYRVVKQPRLTLRQGAYAIINTDGRPLRRGRDLAQALRVLEKKSMRVVD